MVYFALFFGCPARGEKKGELDKWYNGCFAAIIPQLSPKWYCLTHFPCIGGIFLAKKAPALESRGSLWYNL